MKTETDTLVWGPPPPEAKRSWWRILEPLTERPGEWARVLAPVSEQSARDARRYLVGRASYIDPDEWEFAARRLPEGGGWGLWARYLRERP